MKNKVVNLFLKTIAMGGLYAALFSANVACSGGGHQDVLPDSVKKLRKF